MRPKKPRIPAIIGYAPLQKESAGIRPKGEPLLVATMTPASSTLNRLSPTIRPDAMRMPRRRAGSGFFDFATQRSYIMPMIAPTVTVVVTAMGRYMPMPTASGGSLYLRFVVRLRTSSIAMITTPTITPMPMRSQRGSPPITPTARLEISVACGAPRVSVPATVAGGPPWKPKALFRRLSRNGMTRAPAKTPTMRAVCWRHGVAATSWPVFRS